MTLPKLSNIDWRGPAGKLNAEEAAEVARILEGNSPRPHELEPDPEVKPETLSVWDAYEVERLSKK